MPLRPVARSILASVEPPAGTVPSAASTAGAGPRAGPASPSGRDGRPFAHPEVWLLLAALAALACARLAMLLVRAGQTGLEWTGADSMQPHDGMEYLGWIVESSRHVLIANPFRLDPTPADFLHPGLAVSGLLHRLGLSSSAAYLLWKPVAVGALFAAVLGIVRLTLSGRLARGCALALALFTISPTWWLAGHLHPSLTSYVRLVLVRDDLWPGTFLWGYPFGTLGVACLAGGLVAWTRARGAGRLSPWPPLLALAAAWLQPWQGVTLLALIWVTEGVLLRRARRARPAEPAAGAPVALLAATTVAAAIPLAYYLALSRLDPSWELAGRASQIEGWPWWIVPASVAPLAIVALLGYRGPAPGFAAIAIRLWPPAALLLFAFIALTHVGTFAIHALQGLTIPLAVLSVSGVARLRLVRPGRAGALAAVALVAVATVPFAARRISNEWTAVRDTPASDLIPKGERDALRALERDPRAGGVLARAEIGAAVPALAGRRTWVGHLAWTPGFFRRVVLADELFKGRMDPARARAFVRATGARFLLADCASDPGLGARLGPVVGAPRRFGCAAVYTVRGR